MKPSSVRLTSRTTGQVFDFGEVRSINTSYEIAMNSSSVPVFGYKNTFCMDMGVVKKIDIDFVRVNPPAWKQSDLSTDPTRWSNRAWSERITEEFENWQAKGNGYYFNFTPTTSNQYPTTQNIVYISSFVLNLKPGEPRKLAGQIKLTVGSLDMDASATPTTKPLTFRANNSLVTVQNTFSTTVRIGEYFTIPNVPDGWVDQTWDDNNAQRMRYWTANGTRYNPGQRIQVASSTPTTFDAVWEDYQDIFIYNGDQAPKGSRTFENVATIDFMLIGAGGDGGKGNDTYSGGGGAGGGVVVDSINYADDEGDSVSIQWDLTWTKWNNFTVRPKPSDARRNTWASINGGRGEDATDSGPGRGGVVESNAGFVQTGADGDSGVDGAGYMGGDGTAYSKSGGAGGGLIGYPPERRFGWAVELFEATRSETGGAGAYTSNMGLAVPMAYDGGGGCGGTPGGQQSVGEDGNPSGEYIGGKGANGVLCVRVVHKR